MNVLRDLQIAEPWDMLPEDWNFWRDLIGDISEVMRDQIPPAPREVQHPGTPGETASGRSSDLEDDSSPQFLPRTLLTQKNKLFVFTTGATPIHHTPPAACLLRIRGTIVAFQGVLEQMCDVDIVERCPRHFAENTFPIFAVPKPSHKHRII